MSGLEARPVDVHDDAQMRRFHEIGWRAERCTCDFYLHQRFFANRSIHANTSSCQRFAFCGYLPREPGERKERIRELEARSRNERETEIFIETPYRSDALLWALLEACSAQTRLCVAADLTLPSESISTRDVSEWRKQKTAIGRRPAVFLLLAKL